MKHTPKKMKGNERKMENETNHAHNAKGYYSIRAKQVMEVEDDTTILRTRESSE